MNILITGGSGFIGSFIVEEALRRGFDTWVAVRPSSSREYLRDPRLHLIDLDFGNVDRLKSRLQNLRFDYVVHAAGVTKCLDEAMFRQVNTEGTRHLVEALLSLGMPLKRFVYLSSLSVFGAIREQQPYEAITEYDTPQPNTAYGRSKLEAERYLAGVADRLNYVVLRPTGVYGPREKDYFMMVQSIARHIDFAAGFQRQDLTFVYVADVVEAVFLALERGASGRSYFLSDGKTYQSADFSRLIRRFLGYPWCLRITAPLWLLRLITTIGERWGHITGRVTALNNDKYRIMKQRNWRCDVTPAMKELGFTPRYNLEKGVKETVRWYKTHGWI